MDINCKLNNQYKESLKQGRKLMTICTISETIYMGDRIQNRVVKYKGNQTDLRASHTFSRLSCCGIDEGKFSELMYFYTRYKRWHKDFDAVLAFYMDKLGRSRRDKRVFIVGVPSKVRRGSGYNIHFYKRLHTTLKKWGCQSLNTNPYLNLNSRNYISVLVGQFPS